MLTSLKTSYTIRYRESTIYTSIQPAFNSQPSPTHNIKPKR